MHATRTIIATSPSSRLLEDVKNLDQTRANNHH
jgi:hypothetical protein